jgi:hypothetical protein
MQLGTTVVKVLTLDHYLEILLRKPGALPRRHRPGPSCLIRVIVLKKFPVSTPQ